MCAAVGGIVSWRDAAFAFIERTVPLALQVSRLESDKALLMDRVEELQVGGVLACTDASPALQATNPAAKKVTGVANEASKACLSILRIAGRAETNTVVWIPRLVPQLKTFGIGDSIVGMYNTLANLCVLCTEATEECSEAAFRCKRSYSSSQETERG